MNKFLRALAILAVGTIALSAAELVPDVAHGLRLTPGFRVTMIADSPLANDIQTMTFNSRGQLVVSGPGYIKTLIDTNNDTVMDRAELFASSSTGAMGLCFDGSFLYAVSDGAVWRFQDEDENLKADGPPQKLFSISMGEHGGHAIRKGPDGWFYLVTGNDTKFGPEHNSTPQAPVRSPEAGAILRFSGDGKKCEAIAHGFRNPYDFEFFWTGDIFTFDSDTERDFLMPWYKPTRIYHVSHGGHHGWRLSGFQRSWSRPDYYEDTVEALHLFGRGSPTGMTSYRHEHFPLRYRQGIFAADWTFGRIYFFQPLHENASFRTQPELFLEPLGSNGFAPTDLTVGPDGGLYVSVGGRKTRGAVYRISFGAVDLAGGLLAGIKIPTPTTPMEELLKAPQPLDAWSRANYGGVIKTAGRGPFLSAAANETIDPIFRVRAVEILTEYHGGLSLEESSSLTKSSVAAVRARTAWSIGRTYSSAHASALRLLAEDPHALVRKAALDALADRIMQLDQNLVLPSLINGLDAADKRVRQAAVRLASLITEEVWNKLQQQTARSSVRVRLGVMFAQAARIPGPTVHMPSVQFAAVVLQTARDFELRRMAARLLILGLSDNKLADPSAQVYTGYELASDLRQIEGLEANMSSGLSRLFPSGDATLDVELSRLLAMVSSSDEMLVGKILKQISPSSNPLSDVHFLIVLSRLQAPRSLAHAKATSEALLNLDKKLDGKQQRIKQQWSMHLKDVLTRLLNLDSNLAMELLAHPKFVVPNHVEYALTLTGEHRVVAAGLFLKALEEKTNQGITPAAAELFMALPPPIPKGVARKQWAKNSGREDWVPLLAREPEAEDHAYFASMVESSQSAVVSAVLKALQKIPVEQKPSTLVSLARTLRRLTNQPDEAELRQICLAVISKYSGQSFQASETSREISALRVIYAPVFERLSAVEPEVAKAIEEDSNQVRQWGSILKSARWETGNPNIGERLFQQRGCAACHSGTRAIGPELTGVTQRYSISDLFDSIIFPNRDVAPSYQSWRVQTKNGEVLNGVIVFESADGILLQTSLTSTVRLDNAQIVSRQPTYSSLMPSGLLDGAGPQDLADLYAYLKMLVGK